VIEPSALRAKPMAQSRRGVTQMLEAQVHPLVGVMSRFIQLMAPLPLLKPMAQSRRGVLHMPESPHAVIEPLVLRAAKALSVE
jgi:hypothetical protein